MRNSDRFTTFAIVASLIALAFATCTSCVPGFRPVPQVMRIDASTWRSAAVGVEVDCVRADGKHHSWAASGVAISADRALTAGHAIPSGCTESTIKVAFDGGRSYVVTVEAVLVADDVALLVSATRFARDFRPVLAYPVEGAPVCIVAAQPLREVKCGLVEQTGAGIPGDIVHGAVTVPGNSGSGLYDGEGRLVGIVTHYKADALSRPVGGRATSLADLRRSWMVRP